MRDWAEFVLRGAAGGAASWLLVLSCVPGVTEAGLYLVIGALFLALVGCVFGAAVGALIWFLSLKAGRALGPASRAAVGIGASWLLLAGLWLLSKGRPDMSAPAWGDTMLAVAIYAGVGVLTGLMARPKSSVR